MGLPILILGESGTGKSASMRNFKNDEVALVNVAAKPLPFQGKFDETINSDSYRQIKKFIKESFAEVVVVDDAQYLMSNEFMRRASERGYDKFTEIGVNFWDLVRSVVELPEKKIVVFMAHIERDVNGNEKIKTIGKLLDEKITVEGMFTIVLKTTVSDGKYGFLTQNSGHDTVKSPIGLFDALEIDNDLKAVVSSVKKYYNMGGEVEVPFETKTETKEDPIPENPKEVEELFEEKYFKLPDGNAVKIYPKDEIPEDGEEITKEEFDEIVKSFATRKRTRRTRKER